MKIIICLFTILMFNKDCEQHNATESNPITTNSEKSIMTQDNVMITYEAMTRGFYEKIWVSKDSITVSNDRNKVEKVSVSTPQKDWSELTNLIKGIDIKQLPNLEAPTSMRQYDGAAFATLGIIQDKSEILSNSFDHGHPPKQIETLVNKVLSMRELLPKK